MFTTPYNPQANRLCEHSNQTIENILKALVRNNRTQWDNDLAFAGMAYWATPHSTGFSPNILVYGREYLMPCNIMYGQTGAVYNRQHSCFCEYLDTKNKYGGGLCSWASNNEYSSQQTKNVS